MVTTISRDEVDSGLSLKAAERYCAELARREAKNFYWGFIALPYPKRTAIYALYSFARQVDDEADRPPAQRDPARLAFHRERLRRCVDGEACDPVMQVLGRAIEQYRLPAEEVEQVVNGVEIDLWRNRYESWAELERYCSLVASAVGRLCVRIFGFEDPMALSHAHTLGLAMQLTNILRDVREDYVKLGRIYLPLDELHQHGISENDLIRSVADGRAQAPLLAASPLAGKVWDGGYSPPSAAPAAGMTTAHDGVEESAWEAFVRFEARRARELFASGLEVSKFIPRSSAACVLTMAGIYQEILGEIERDPSLPLTQRISLPASTKARVMVRAWLQVKSR